MSHVTWPKMTGDLCIGLKVSQLSGFVEHGYDYPSEWNGSVLRQCDHLVRDICCLGSTYYLYPGAHGRPFSLSSHPT